MLTTDTIDHRPYEPQVRGMCARMARHYPTAPDDLFQEVMVEFYQPDFQAKLAGRLDNTDGDGESVARWVLGMARRVAHRHAIAEKAAAEGFSPDDLYSYSPPQVAELLVQWVGRCRDGVMPAPAEQGGRGGGGADPATGGGVLASMVDVGRAVLALPEGQRRFLTETLLVGVSDDEYAEAHGVDVKSVGQRHRRIVGRLCAWLNEYREQAVAAHEGPGSRRAVSNESARRMGHA